MDIRAFLGKPKPQKSSAPKRRIVTSDTDEDIGLAKLPDEMQANAKIGADSYFARSTISKIAKTSSGSSSSAKNRAEQKKEDRLMFNESDSFELDDSDLRMIDIQGPRSTSDPPKGSGEPEIIEEANWTKERPRGPSVQEDAKSVKRPADCSAPSVPSRKKSKYTEEENFARSEVGFGSKQKLQTTPPAKAPEKGLRAASAVIASIAYVELPELVQSSDYKFQQAAPPPASAPGSKQIPDGARNCLAGLTFVFTGVLQSLERTEAQDLVKRYGGKLTTAPSKKTDFVVLGDQAGPKKVEKIKTLGIKCISEDSLLDLIARMPADGGEAKAAQKALEKIAVEVSKAQAGAKRMEQAEEAEQRNVLRKAASARDKGVTVREPLACDQLWTVKYAPKAIKDIIGNKGNVEKLVKFLVDWPKNLKSGFKKPGPDGSGLYRAILISGSPGIGKTSSAHLACRMANYDLLEFNASDTRSKRLLEEGLKSVIDNSSVNGYFSSSNQVNKEKKNFVLVMDEIDGMSAGDRGGVGALNTIIRKTRIPIICICNDRSSQKLKPLDRTTFDIKFTKPTKDMIRSKIMSIAFKEGLSIQPTAIDQLVDSTGSDIRQIVNLLSTYRLTMSSMDQEEGRKGGKMAEKHIILKPWDIVGKFLSGGLYAAVNKVSLNEKIELYFNDHEMSYLMLQENYLRTNPDRIRFSTDVNPALMKLQLADRAANAISDGDLTDAMIHGPQQHWSLMPTHAVLSCVRPASFISGSSNSRYVFTSLLGNMSKASKATRQLREIRSHLKLRVSGDRFEIRDDYLPVMFNRLPRVLAERGVDAVNEVVKFMDDYYLSKDDWDSLLELGIGVNDGEEIARRIPTTVKSSFTRTWNKGSHPVPFIASSVVTVAKGRTVTEVPDVEDAVEVSDDEAAAVETKEMNDEESLRLDKAIVAPKKRAGPKVKNTEGVPKRARTVKKR